MNIKVLVEPGEDGYFVARVPALKSCWSQGKIKEDALENVREAIDLYLEREDWTRCRWKAWPEHTVTMSLTIHWN